MSSSAVHAIADAVDAADPAVADTATCERMVGELNQVFGWAQAAFAGHTSGLGALHETVGGAPPADVHQRCGGVSAAEGKRRELRPRDDWGPALVR